jgi:hypothetical protein
MAEATGSDVWIGVRMEPSRLATTAIPRPPAAGRGVTRRRLMTGLIALPALGVVLAGGRRLGRAGPLLRRPGANGSSADRCASCGAADHTMLAAVCPMRPEVGW